MSEYNPEPKEPVMGICPKCGREFNKRSGWVLGTEIVCNYHAPKEEGWEKEFDEKFLTDFGMEIVSWNVEDPSPGEIKHFIREHFIPKERVEKWRAVIGGMSNNDPREAGQFAMHSAGYNQALEEVLSLLSEDK